MRRKVNPLKAFEQHGFVEIKSTKEQTRGTCPFCGGDKFFIKPELKRWDCKHCTREGGYKTFLREINKICQENFIGDNRKWLANDRSISGTTLKNLGVGYNPITDNYTFPIPEIGNEDIWNIYIYNKKGFIGTAGANQGLLGWENYHNEVNIIWLCEGHWDYAVMCEILDFMEKENEIAMGVPGVKDFKDEWALFFKNKYVFVVYDADHDKDRGGKIVNPAREGSIKVFNKLSRIARELKFVHWVDRLKDGYDLRDRYIEDELEAEETYSYLINSLNELPNGVNLDDLTGKKLKDIDIREYSGSGLNYQDVYNGFSKHLKLKSYEPLDIFYGSILANRFPGDPVWMILVGPSGCGKSEILMSAKDAPRTYSLDDLTPHTLVSGSIGPGGSDPSLLPQIDGMVLDMKDLTTIWEKNSNARDEIFGQLRSAFDGEYSKPFGVGTIRSFESKFGIITGMTRYIELLTERYTALGERFLRYNMPVSRSPRSRQNILLKALDNIRLSNKDIMRKDLKELTFKVLDYDFGQQPNLSDKYAKLIVKLADLVSIMRGAIIRDTYTKQIQHQAFVELGTRLVTELGKLALGITQFKGKDEVDEEIFIEIRHVAESSVTSLYNLIVKPMYKRHGKNKVEEDEIIKFIRLPKPRVQQLLENLTVLNVMTRKKLSSRKTYWGLTDSIFYMLKETNFYE